MKLTGFQIKVGDESRFIGKVGVCPMTYTALPELHGHLIFYRETPRADAVSYATNALGYDRAVLDRAMQMQVVAFVNWCKDTRELLVVTTETVRKHAFVVDLGEHPQYRIPLRHVRVLLEMPTIDMGWTTHVETIDVRRPIASNAIAQQAREIDRRVAEHARAQEQATTQMALF